MVKKKNPSMLDRGLSPGEHYYKLLIWLKTYYPDIANDYEEKLKMEGLIYE